MTEQQMAVVQEAEFQTRKILDSLMQNTMNTVTGIREAREAVVAAQNALNRLLQAH